MAGKVTLDGQPLAKGVIQFIPRAGDGRGAAWAEIADGAYAIAGADGPAPGAYDVTIAPDVEEEGAGAAEIPDTPGDPPADAVDGPTVAYTPASPLQADVSAGGPNTFNFDLTTTRRSKSRRR